LEAVGSELARLGHTLLVALERSEGLLVEHLQELGHVVYPVNPRIAARAREGYRVASSKDDAFDAFVLADLLRQQAGRWCPLPRPSARLAELQALVHDRQRTVENQVRVEAQLRATLEAYHPAVLHLFSSLDRDVSLDFIRSYPTPERAARVGMRRMARFLATNSYRGRQPAESLVKRLSLNLLKASPGTAAGKHRAALALTDELELLNRHLKSFDAAIDEVLNHHPDAHLFLSFPGVGTILAATLLAEIGEDRSRFPRPDVLLAEAGLAPVTRSSGRTTRVRFRYAANTSLREAFCWWAFNTLRLSPWSRQAYQSARARGQHHYRALRGLGARWARILWRCWKDSVTYNPDRHSVLAS
jgi:transposase